MTTDASSTFDLERIIPQLLSVEEPIEREILNLHQARYQFAARFVPGRRVLDIACGVGYGSEFLRAAGATVVVGVDRCAEAVAYAKDHYQRAGIDFVQADAVNFRPEKPFDVVVSLETIEHLPDAAGFMARLPSFVGPGGMVVASVPTTLSSDVNPHHLHDFSASQFRRMFREGELEIIDELIQVQPFSPLGLLRLRGRSKRRYEFRKGLAGYYARHPAMLVRRLAATLRHGCRNKYLVLVGRKR